MNGTHHPSWGILLPVCSMEPTKRAPWRIRGISSNHACNCLKICSDVLSFVIQKNRKTKDNLMPHSMTFLIYKSQNSWTSSGNAYKMRGLSAKALVHSIYLLTFFRNVYKVLSNSEKQFSYSPLSLSSLLPSPSLYLSSASLFHLFKSLFSLLPASQTSTVIKKQGHIYPCIIY